MEITKPISIGKMVLSNRIIMPPMTTNFSKNGFVTKRMIDYYEERAKGGVSMITVEDAIVESPLGNHCMHPLRIDSDAYVDGLKKLASHIKKQGIKVILQLSHSGRRGGRVDSKGCLSVTRGLVPVAPSSIPHPAPGYVIPKELSYGKIFDLITKFVQAACRVKEAGFDGVQLHGAHLYLIGQFLSPACNQRWDEFGNSFEGRMKFISEIIKGIRQELGDYPLLVRINGEERGIERGLTLTDSIAISKQLEKAGVDAIHVSVGAGAAVASEDFVPPVAPMRFPEGCIVGLAEAIKANLSIPVITVNKINNLDLAEKIISEGKADIVAMGRALIADPQIINKSLFGKKFDVKPCIGCLQGCLQRVLEQNKEMSCSVNPFVWRKAFNSYRKSNHLKRVVVIGAGPSGLEAALTISKRGHKVIVLEKEDGIGGQLLKACRPPGKKDIEKLINYYKKQIESSKIEIQLRKIATKQYVEDLNPDAIVLATGSKPVIPKNFVSSKILTTFEVLTQERDLGAKIVIIGGGRNGVEIAEYLAERGKKVSVIEKLEEIGKDMPALARIPLLFNLQKLKVEVMTNTEVESIKENEVTLKSWDKKWSICADSVIVAVGNSPNTEILENMKKIGCKIYTCGDVNEPRDILHAVKEGFEVGSRI